MIDSGPLIKNTVFQKGPPIGVKVYSSPTQILRTTLFESSSFNISIFGNPATSFLLSIQGWFEAYASGDEFENLPLKQDTFSPFQQHVLQCMRQIPFGEILSYGQLACSAGSPKAARAVGTCCRLNPFPLLIPCHRVVLSSGKIGQFLYGSDMKKELLAFEKSHKKAAQLV